MSFLSQTLANPNGLEATQQRLSTGVEKRLLDTGVVQFSPASETQPSYRVVISSGVHGNETAPMEIVDQLIAEIESGALSVANEVMFIIGNPPAAVQQTRFIEENLNRLFSGKHRHGDNYECRRAAQLESMLNDFFSQGHEARIHYDLHTAIRPSKLEKFVVYPYLHQRPVNKAQLGFLDKCGIQAALLSNQASGTFSYYSSHHLNADAFTVELGKVRPFGENDLANFSQITQGLRDLIADQERFNQKPENIQVFKVVEEVIKRSEDLVLHIPDDAVNFTDYPKGTLFAEDQNYTYVTQQDGERFVFPISDVPIGQRAMLIVAPSQLN